MPAHPDRQNHTPDTTTCETTCRESSTPCMKCLQRMNPRLLAFRLPLKRLDEADPPPTSAHLGDKLQWLAAHRPHAMQPLAEAVEYVLSKLRHSPQIYIPPRTRRARK